MTNAGKGSKTPRWLIERLAAGELDAETAASVRRRLAEEGRSVDEEVAALARSSDEILAAHPPGAVAAEVRRRARARQPETAARRLHTLVLGGALAAAGAAALILVPRTPPGGRGPVESSPGPETTTPKGPAAGPNARLYVYRHGSVGDLRLRDGERAARGDLLQLAYAAPKRTFGVLLSIDGAGRVTQHWPEAGVAQAGPLRPGGEVRLPSSYELDDAPSFERFFLVEADQPFDVTSVLRAARALASRPAAARRDPLSLPAGFAQASLALDKRPSQETP